MISLISLFFPEIVPFNPSLEMIIDNVLWYGQVVDDNCDDKITLTIKDFNNYVSKDKRVEKIIVPLGDGMTVCRKL